MGDSPAQEEAPREALPDEKVELSEEDLERVAGGGKTFLIFVSGPNGTSRPSSS